MFNSPIEKQRFITARRLVQAAYECRHEGIMACSRKAACLSDIGLAIHAVADAYGYDTVKHYRGHGIGTDFHCAPFVKHFRNDDRLELQSGMVFTIEPMITEGKQDCEEWDDDWTVVTKDGGRAAQFEHTVLITDNGVEILTLP
jgi:methionyl aminopeptidase